MIAVDTNVLVRLLTRDDPEQFELSRKLFAEEAVFIPDTVFLESEWVLRYAYQFEPGQIAAAFKKVLGLGNVHVADTAVLAMTLHWHEAGIDFADALHLAAAQTCNSFATFDKTFARDAEVISSCPVKLLA